MSTTAQHRARPPQAGTRLGPPRTPAQSWDKCAKETCMPGSHPHAASASITPLCCLNAAQGQVLLDGSQAVPEGHLRTFGAHGFPAGGCPERMGTQRVLRVDGSWGACVQDRVCLDLGCQSRSEWQGRVWPSSGPAGVSKGQCLGMPQLFPAQQDFQKKLSMAISGWALTHPWLGAKGCTAPAMAAPYPTTVLLGRHCFCPHPALLHEPSVAAGNHRQPFQNSISSCSGCMHPAGLMCVPRGAWQGQDW